MISYYNEIDDYAADWLENLIAAGHIAPGVVDRRSIEDVQPDDLRGFTQCHFFAGIGVWSYALRLAGWPDDRPVWTGSCPCQPFSGAGKRDGAADPRHLWPVWIRLIRECRPHEILGEQVAGGDGLVWADIVQPEMEDADYACGFVDTCSAGHRAPHIRQRLRFAAYDLRSSAGWVADADDAGSQGRGVGGNGTDQRALGASGLAGGVADPSFGNQRRHAGNARGSASSGGGEARSAYGGTAGSSSAMGRPSPLDGFWRDADWLLCRDGKWRPVEPGLEPLAHGAPARVGRLRAYGNAVDAQATAAFIRAYMEVTKHMTMHGGLETVERDVTAPTCHHCGAEMAAGVALVPAVSAGVPDFPGDDHASTFSFGAAASLTPCVKCVKCGRSVLVDREALR